MTGKLVHALCRAKVSLNIYITTGGGSLRLYTHAAVAEDIVCFYFSLTSTNLILRLLFCENEDGRAAPALLGHNCPHLLQPFVAPTLQSALARNICAA